MSKPKPSKHSHRPKKTATKAQRAAQAIVRSPSHSRLRSLRAGSTDSSLKRNDPKRETLLVENPATALQTEAPLKHNDPKQEALLGENPAAAEAACKQTMRDNGSRKALDFSSAATNVRAYQAKLLEMAEANMQFAFDFAQRLATIRSPVEFPGVIAAFTYKRIAMFHKVFDRNG